MNKKRIGLVIAGDFVAFWLSLFLILAMKYNPLASDIVVRHFEPFLILYLSWVLIFYLFGLYDMFTIKPTIPHLKRFFLALAVAFVFGIIFFYLIPSFGISPKTNLLFQIIGFGAISFLLRRLFYSLYSKKFARPAVLVGNSYCMQKILSTIMTNPHLGLRALAHSSDMSELTEDYGKIKNVLFIIEKVNGVSTDDEILNLYKNKIEVIDVVQAYETYLQKIPVRHIDQTWIVENINAKRDVFYVVLSRVVEVAFSIFALIATSPIVLLSAVAIYIEDKGKIFYTQERVGLNNKIFRIIKIRSMVENAEKNGAVWSSVHDERVTKVGKVLRKLHIDEIPQMINILKGDIALVGPRPERPEFVKELEEGIPYYDLRHSIRPGFTGWAQIKFHYARTEQDSREKFEYDLYYIKNRNIFIDFGIFLRTVQIIFTH